MDPGTPDRGEALEFRHARVVVEVERYRIEGTLTLPSQGYRSRLSDFINQREGEFLCLTDVIITGIDTVGYVQRVPFVMVAQAHIRLIAPADGAS